MNLVTGKGSNNSSSMVKNSWMLAVYVQVKFSEKKKQGKCRTLKSKLYWLVQ